MERERVEMIDAAGVGSVVETTSDVVERASVVRRKLSHADRLLLKCIN
jgi:hypothetical protein